MIRGVRFLDHKGSLSSQLLLQQGQEHTLVPRFAEMLLSRGKPQDALTNLDKALVKDPNNTDLLHLRGRCLQALGNMPGVSAVPCHEVLNQELNQIKWVSLWIDESADTYAACIMKTSENSLLPAYYGIPDFIRQHDTRGKRMT